MEPGVIAAIAILSVELIIIIVILVFLFTGNCPPKCCNKDPSPESGAYKRYEDNKDEKSSPKDSEETVSRPPNNSEDTGVVAEVLIIDANTDVTATKIAESSSSSSDEGVGDVQKIPSNAESSSSSTDSDNDEAASRVASPSGTSNSSHFATAAKVEAPKTTVDQDCTAIEHRPSSNPPAVSIDDGITFSLRLDNPAFEADASSSSSSEDEDEIRVFRVFEDISDEIGEPGEHNLQGDATPNDSNDESESRDEVVAGIINVTSGEKLTISQAVAKGLIPERTGVLLLEAQAATGCVVNPKTAAKLSANEALRQGVVDEKYKSIITTAEGAYYGYLDPRTHESVPLFEAMKRGIFPRSHGLRLLEAQVATGGIVDPWSGKSYPLPRAVNKGLIDECTAKILTNPEDHAEFFDPNTKERFCYGNLLSKCIRDLNTGLKFLYLEEKPTLNHASHRYERIAFRSAFKRTVTIRDLVNAGLVNQRTVDQYSVGNITKTQLYEELKPYLVGEAPIAGVYNRTSREVLTICQAVRKGLLRRGTALELLEAQAATGYIIDPKSGKQMSVNRAVSIGLVDGRFSSSLKKVESAILGVQSDKHHNLSLFAAINRGLVIEIQGIRLLDAQMATGGIIDPSAGYRIPLSVAVKRGILDQELANKLANPTSDQKGYYDPNSDENVTYKELMRRTVIDKKRNVGMRLLPLTEKTPNVRVVSKEPTKAKRIVAKNQPGSKVR